MDAPTGPVGGAAITVDPADGRPLHEQLEHALRTAIRSGRLAAGSRLPSTRALSGELGVSRGVVTAAYAQLAAEGYLVTRQGAPVRVSDAIRGAEARPAARSMIHHYPYDLRPGMPDLVAFPRTRWLGALTASWRRSAATTLGEIDPRGVPELRDALAAYLDRVRGTAADPELLMVCTGFTQAFALTCRWLASQGVGTIAIEDPGWHTHAVVAEEHGLRALPVPVDEHGIDVAALSAADAAAVVVTPAHHFPTGAVLSAERRAALLDWAERHDRLIVEDDYDAELRYAGSPVGALQGLAPERVLYVGSASKRLAPGLRLGWALLPSWLTWPLVSAKAVADGGSEVLGQLAVADLIGRGELERHVRRMRLAYAARRAALLAALAEHVPDARVGDDPAGLHELVWLPDGTDEAAVLAAAAHRGVGLEGLSWHRNSADGSPGLLAGYAALPEPSLREAVRRLGAAITNA